MSEIFREKSMDRLSSPEQLDDYIRVTTPSVWLVLTALVILLIGVITWSVLGTVTVNTADGTQETINPISIVIN